MSEQRRLPEDLMALEARLAAQSLPTVSLDRDEVLFRAGWAAADAAAARARPYQLAARIAWPVGSAVAAACLAILATLHRSDRPISMARAIPAMTTRESVDDGTVPDVPARSSPAWLRAPRGELSRVATIRSRANVLTLRDQLLESVNWMNGEESELSTRPATSASPPETVRNGLLEFLPEGTSYLYES